jgi:hypothetical protein
LLARRSIACQRMLNSIQQVLVAKRLGEKFHRPGFHRLHRHRDVSVPGNKDDGDIHPSLRECALQVEAAQSGQPDVEHQATRHI